MGHLTSSNIEATAYAGKSSLAIISIITPDDDITHLSDFLNNLYKSGFLWVILVADGVSLGTEVETLSFVSVQRNWRPLGRGRSLKNAINYYLNNCGTYFTGVVMTDCSVSIGDITAIGNAQLQSTASDTQLNSPTGTLHLGVSSATGDSRKQSFKKRVSASRFLFKLLAGLPISATDSQSHLRACGNDFLSHCLTLEGERFDLETNMLLEAKQRNVQVIPFRVSGIGSRSLSAESFNPLTDSISIYRPLLRFLWTTIAAISVNILVFWLSMYFFSSTVTISWPWLELICVALGQLVCGCVHFVLNRSTVFSYLEHKEQLFNAFGKYMLLWVMQLMCSFGGMAALAVTLRCSPVAVKIPLDTFLFLMSFQIQREWVFQPEIKDVHPKLSKQQAPPR